MNERATLLPPLIVVDVAVDREFESQLVEASRLVFRVAYSVLRHREDAEDVAQEACVLAYRRFYQLRDRERFRPWVVRMAWRLALDRQRTNRRRLAHESRPSASVRRPLREGDPNGVTALDGLLARERTEQLWAAIDALPEKLRLVVVLSSIKEHETTDVAALLGLPEGTVKSRLFLARQRLREYLKCHIEP